MRYYYEPINAETYACDHPLYNRCTLYLKDGKGLAVVQNRYSPKAKVSWLGPIDKELIYVIPEHEGFNEFFDKNSSSIDQNGLYPSVMVRTIMWALKMKPLRKNIWESGL